MLINENLFIEADYCQRSSVGNRTNGDVYLQKRFDNSIVSVLLSGASNTSIHSNITATVLSSMIITQFDKFGDIRKVAESAIGIISIGNGNKLSKPAFTIVRMGDDAKVEIICYGTPKPICLRGEHFIEISPTIVQKESAFGDDMTYNLYQFHAKGEDRVVIFNNLDIIDYEEVTKDDKTFWTDTTGIIRSIIEQDFEMSAAELSKKIILESYNYKAGYKINGDQSCGVIYFRKPRKILIVSGPPFDEAKDKYLADMVKDFKGSIVISGGTTAGIISRELEREITVKLGRDPSGLPNESSMDGVSMITEGVLTLERVKKILNKISDQTVKGRGIDIKLTKLILDHDVVEFIIGTRVNAMHQNPNIPMELELRKTILKNIFKLLKEKFFKEVKIKQI